MFTKIVPISVPEFLYQLTKMLMDEHWDFIERFNTKIEVYVPHGLSEVLHKELGRSKHTSFQRQLNDSKTLLGIFTVNM